MFLLTPAERKVIIAIGILILIGSVVRLFNVTLSKNKLSDKGTNYNAAAAGKTRLVVNVNHADKESLMTLSGIGEKTADLLIDYRLQFGEFKTLEDLKKVKGIGEKKLNNIAKDIEF